MEYLNTYTEGGEFIKKVSRAEAHEKGLWHKTNHCWILRPNGKILFQMRSLKLKDNPGRLYTTAGGHVQAGEDLKTALQREIKEELGIELNTAKASQFGQGLFKVDFITTDGKEYHDRAMYHQFFIEDNSPLTDYNFQDEELEGLYEVDVANTLAFMKGEKDSLTAIGVFKENGKTITKDVTVKFDQFQFVNQGTPYEKFGAVLEKALEYFAKK